VANLADVADKIQEETRRAAAVVGVLGAFDDAPHLDTLVMVYVQAMLKLERGNKTAAARRLGITRWRLMRLLEREAA